MKYNHLVVEPKWQKAWEEKGCFHAEENSDKKKFYALIEFPYPSGQGLHVGHPRPYTALDVVSRKRRLQGYNVLYPIGWDAFGLPTENYAIKNHIHPEIVTKIMLQDLKSKFSHLVFLLTGVVRSIQPILNIINGLSGFSYSYLSMV